MNLTILFFKRLFAQHILSIFLLVSMGLVSFFGMYFMYQSTLWESNERHEMIELKNEFQFMLKSQDALDLNERELVQIKDILELSNQFIEQSYKLGKTSSVLEIEKQLYEQLMEWFETGNTLQSSSREAILEKLTIVTFIQQNKLIFHYLNAPKDFYLFVYKASKYLMLILPFGWLVIFIWMLLEDRKKHRGFLMLNDSTLNSYSVTLTLNYFLYTMVSLLWILGCIWGISKILHFSFQISYPILKVNGQLVEVGNELFKNFAIYCFLVFLSCFVLFIPTQLIISKKR